MATALQSVETYRCISRPGSEAPACHCEQSEDVIASVAKQSPDVVRLLRRCAPRKDGWHQEGLLSCAHWLNFKCGIGLNAAREKVRVAHALKKLPTICAAFERGELSYSKVRAMMRIADNSNEDYLMVIAHHGTAHHMEQLVQKYRRAKRLQDCDHVNQQHKGRYFGYHYDHDGCLVIKGRLRAEQGALIVNALEKALEQDFVGAASSRNSDAETSTDDTESEPIAARRADAIAEMAETYLNSDKKPGATADRYQVVVHEGGFDCRRTASGEIIFTTPDQQMLPAFTRTRPIDEDPHAWFEKKMRQQDINPLTCVPEWYAGDTMDWDLAVAALFPSPSR